MTRHRPPSTGPRGARRSRLALVLSLAGASVLGAACEGAEPATDRNEAGAEPDDVENDAEVADAATEDATSEAGARDSEAEPELDASASSDAGAPNDAGSRSDATVRADASADAGPRTDASTGQDAGGADIGPSGCLDKFKPACSPSIVFKNDEPTGRGAIFASVILDPQATMQDALCAVCSILYREPSEIPERSRHKTVNLTLRDNPNVADASGNSIRIDLKHIANYKDPAKALRELRGIMVHEGAHLYQNYGNGGLGEGMADFVRIRVGLYEPGRRSTGGAWTDPYTTSGFFFSWLAGPGVYHKDGREPHNIDIGYLINKTIGADGADAVPGLLQKTFGADVDTLWREYQADIK